MTQDYPKEVILKDGTCVTFRPLREGDETLLLRMHEELSEDDRWFSDGEATDLRSMELWVKEMDLDRLTTIVAVLEGRIISSATLRRTYTGARSHIGKISIHVVPAFRVKNLGTWMLFDLMNLAMDMGLEILVMELVEDRDAPIIRGAKRLDFFQEALLKNYVKDRHGANHGLAVMIKRLYLGWRYEGGLNADNPLLMD